MSRTVREKPETQRFSFFSFFSLRNRALSTSDVADGEVDHFPRRDSYAGLLPSTIKKELPVVATQSACLVFLTLII